MCKYPSTAVSYPFLSFSLRTLAKGDKGGESRQRGEKGDNGGESRQRGGKGDNRGKRRQRGSFTGCCFGPLWD